MASVNQTFNSTLSINKPYREVIAPNSTVTYNSDYKSVSYIVIGINGTITTDSNGLTTALFDGESGSFEADDNNSFASNVTFITGADTTVIVNAIIRA